MTLIEVLVVVAIIAVLITILLPSFRFARIGAKIVKAHAELKSIEQALLMYHDEQADQLPPTRFSCSMRTAYELPVELGEGNYLPLRNRPVQTAAGSGFINAVDMPDVFAPHETYKYRAVGPAIMNEFTVLEPPNGASLWVPKDFPDVTEMAGRYWFDPRESPVRYALWSIGPDPDSPKFTAPGVVSGRKPVPKPFWCRGSTDTGVITHYQARDGKSYMSP